MRKRITTFGNIKRWFLFDAQSVSKVVPSKFVAVIDQHISAQYEDRFANLEIFWLVVLRYFCIGLFQVDGRVSCRGIVVPLKRMCFNFLCLIKIEFALALDKIAVATFLYIEGTFYNPILASLHELTKNIVMEKLMWFVQGKATMQVRFWVEDDIIKLDFCLSFYGNKWTIY